MTHKSITKQVIMKYLSDEDVFQTARDEAEGLTQKQVAKKLDCSQGAVSRMLRGEPKMLSLAMRWITLNGWEIEGDNEGNPKRYFKAEKSS